VILKEMDDKKFVKSALKSIDWSTEP
jgi:hypothetical protein